MPHSGETSRQTTNSHISKISELLALVFHRKNVENTYNIVENCNAHLENHTYTLTRETKNQNASIDDE